MNVYMYMSNMQTTMHSPKCLKPLLFIKHIFGEVEHDSKRKLGHSKENRP